MTDHHTQPEGRHEIPLDSAGALIRAAADGELTAADQRRLDELRVEYPRLDASIAFEQGLREATGRAMASHTPAGLADRVRGAIRADDELADSLEEMGGQTRDPSFWTRRAWMSALAAVLVFALSAALILQASRLSTVPLSTEQIAYRGQLAGFLKTQHEKTCEDLIRAQQGKLKFDDPTAFEEELTRRLRRQVKLPSSEGSPPVRFVGGGACGVPGEGPSAHMVYTTDFSPQISVFVKQDNGELPLEPGRTYALNTEECGLAGSRILTRIEAGLIYFFVFDEAPGCQRALAALGVSVPSARY